MSRALYLVGVGGHAQACIDVVEQTGLYEIKGLIGLPDEIGDTVLGYSVVGDDSIIATLVSPETCFLVSVGQIRSSETRCRLFKLLTNHRANLPVIVSPSAYVSRHSQVSSGTIVMHGAIINANATIGKNCIINNRALVEHGARIGNHCHIATAATINGDATVGNESFVGSASVIRNGIDVGSKCVIGMGLSVHRNCAEYTLLR